MLHIGHRSEQGAPGASEQGPQEGTGASEATRGDRSDQGLHRNGKEDQGSRNGSIANNIRAQHKVFRQSSIH